MEVLFIHRSSFSVMYDCLIEVMSSLLALVFIDR